MKIKNGDGNAITAYSKTFLQIKDTQFLNNTSSYSVWVKSSIAGVILLKS
jgi:hypothetical protein